MVARRHLLEHIRQTTILCKDYTLVFIEYRLTSSHTPSELISGVGLIDGRKVFSAISICWDDILNYNPILVFIFYELLGSVACY